MARPHIEPFVDRDVGFKKLTMKGFKPGIQHKTLSIDKDTGACTMTIQYDAGFKQPPGFSYSEYEMLIMEGSLRVGDKTARKGAYFFVPAGVHLPAISTDEGAFALIFYNFGPPSFQESDRDHDQADRAGFKIINAYEDLDWIMYARRTPGVAPGCCSKVLTFDEKTGACTFLYCMVPGFWQDNISYHDCAEEAYHIWGTSWMMQFGNLPTGGYFWRPAYINHGAFASQNGILAIGRTDGDLHNHFHHDPFSTPAENQERAAQVWARQRPATYKWILTNGHNHGPHDFSAPNDAYDPVSYHVADIADVNAHDYLHSHDIAHDHPHEHGHGGSRAKKKK
jgi:hypothetical protein